MRFSTEAVFSAVDTTTTSNSSAIDTSQVFACSLQAVIATAGTGTLKLQFSNDAPLNGSPTSWSDITNATVATTGAGTYAIVKTDCCYRWIRAVYTATSGTGTITATLHTQAM